MNDQDDHLRPKGFDSKTWVTIATIVIYAFLFIPDFVKTWQMTHNRCDAPSTPRYCFNEDINSCDVVHLTETQSPECQQKNVALVQQRCGTDKPVFYNDTKQCSQRWEETQCPADLSLFNPATHPGLFLCTALKHKLCRAVCGERYDRNEIRQAYQNRGNDTLICIDDSLEKTKNGYSIFEDTQRKLCIEQTQPNGIEIHSGAEGREWCVTYNKKYKNIDYGPAVQCLGRLK